MRIFLISLLTFCIGGGAGFLASSMTEYCSGRIIFPDCRVHGEKRTPEANLFVMSCVNDIWLGMEARQELAIIRILPPSQGKNREFRQ